MVEIRLTFREGGAFDFHTIFEQIKERLYQAYTVARETGQRGDNVNLANVDLEQLPAYEPAGGPAREEETVILSPIPVRPGETRNSGVAGVRSLAGESPKPQEAATPAEPPPDYEETQAQAVGVELDERLRGKAGRR
jgi:hypothetical protein